MDGDFYFGSLRDEKELKLLESFLLSQPMDYPSYEEWVRNVCIPEIDLGWKKTVLAFYRNYRDWQLVGNAIYQPAKESQLPSTLHFKNMRVKEELRREGIASFLIKQVEKAALAEGLEYVILDFREGRKDILGLFLWHSYQHLFTRSLYDSNPDVVMVKNIINPKEKGFLVH